LTSNICEFEFEFFCFFFKTIVHPDRKFIREGVLVKMCRREPKRRYFVLFSDLLIYGSMNDSSANLTKATITFHRALDLSQVNIEDVRDGENLNAFQVLSKQKSFAVFAESPDHKLSWMNDFEVAKSICAEQNAKSKATTKGRILFTFFQIHISIK
jgi:hypothetical protein